MIADGHPTPAPTAGCVDHLGVTSGNEWFDGWNVCGAYAVNPGWCDSFGIHDYNGEGAATWACCACGGGWHATASPTPSPTTSSTPSPSPSPTPSPTSLIADAMPGAMSGTMSVEMPGSMSISSNVITAVGDPHLQNVHGERFDLMKPGRHVLINIPRGERPGNTLLRVVAEARRLGGACADLYFLSINITGALAEKKRKGGYHYKSWSTVKTTPKWLAFGHRGGFGCEVKVAHGRTQQGLAYLNFYIRHLARAGFAVGGLLGEDDHSVETTPPAACLKTMELHGQAEVYSNRSAVSSNAAASFT